MTMNNRFKDCDPVVKALIIESDPLEQADLLGVLEKEGLQRLREINAALKVLALEPSVNWGRFTLWRKQLQESAQ